MLQMITSFAGNDFFLSNFSRNGFELNGIKYDTVEHFYQASKAITTDDHLLIVSANTPREAKNLGRLVDMRQDWDTIKDKFMYNGLFYKFNADYILKTKLLNTKGSMLIEGNTWHDNYWGMCSCPKCANTPSQNTLGVLLMTLRANHLIFPEV